MANILGVLGARNAITKQIMQDEILTPILDDLGKKLTKVLVPSEPLSSTFIECWANRQDIPVELIQSDWARDGRRAGVIRDYRIEAEATALLIFEGPKSRYYVDLAERVAKKQPGRPVYLVHANSVSPVLLEVEQGIPFSVSDKDEKDILKKTASGKSNNTLLNIWSKPQTCLIVDD